MKKEGESSVDPTQHDLTKARIDEETGMYVCPECGQLVNQGCRNCFHARYKDEDPFNFNSEAVINEKLE
jgi:predicted RNA-binding Zn-ribbon protein involved in translation (DUF1610 family)